MKLIRRLKSLWAAFMVPHEPIRVEFVKQLTLGRNDALVVRTNEAWPSEHAIVCALERALGRKDLRVIILNHGQVLEALRLPPKKRPVKKIVKHEAARRRR